jgi:type IV secretory pathway ATPase VirB11/archaellum biosynthesis ATPase
MDVVLKSQLKPLQPFLDHDHLIELSAIAPGAIGLELVGIGYEWQQAPLLTYDYWRGLCHILANGGGIQFDPETQPRIATALPGGHRFEALLGKSVETGLSISIRMYRQIPMELEDFGLMGELKAEVIAAVEAAKSTLISGGTSSGKTTFLNRLIQYIPLNLRVLTVEDTREIRIPHVNHVSYVVSGTPISQASKRLPSQELTYPLMIDHLMRSRPDIIISGELSVPNAFPILRLLNTGHGGFMCTVHANSPELALEEAIPTNIRLSGMEVPNAAEFMRKTIDLVIQLHKVGPGKRQVTDLWFPKTGRRIKLYDRNGKHDDAEEGKTHKKDEGNKEHTENRETIENRGKRGKVNLKSLRKKEHADAV